MKHEEQTWFADALRHVLATRGWNQSQLAEHLATDRQSVSRYLGGILPAAERIAPLLACLGSDITRALPMWEPPTPGSAELQAENRGLRERVATLEAELRLIASRASAAASAAEQTSEKIERVAGRASGGARKPRRR